LRTEPALSRWFLHLMRHRVQREVVEEGARGDRQSHVTHVGSLVDQAHHRSARPEFAVVGVRCEDEHAFPGSDHAAIPITKDADWPRMTQPWFGGRLSVGRAGKARTP